MRVKYNVMIFYMGIIIVIISSGVLARKSLSVYEQESIPVISQKSIYNDTYNLDSYLTYLQEYLSASKVPLSAEDESKKDLLIQELMIIANIEKKNSIQHMSIDGSEIAISLIKNIYELYGVNIAFGMDVEIQKVEDSLGNMLYQYADNALKIEIQVIHLSIVILLIIILFGLSILITRRSNISVQDGDIYGFEKKKYS